MKGGPGPRFLVSWLLSLCSYKKISYKIQWFILLCKSIGSIKVNQVYRVMWISCSIHLSYKQISSVISFFIINFKFYWITINQMQKVHFFMKFDFTAVFISCSLQSQEWNPVDVISRVKSKSLLLVSSKIDKATECRLAANGLRSVPN